MTDDRWLSELHWRRESQQSRSEKTQTALLDSAEEMIVERGIDATSITDVAAAAGYSVGAVYHHFKDKRALFYAVFHRWTQTLSDLNAQASNAELWEDASVLELLAGYIDFMHRVREEAATSKAAAALVVADNPELRQHIAEITRDGHRALHKLIMAKRDQIGHENPDWAVAFIIDQIGVMQHARVDPAQKVIAISGTDDATFREETLKIARNFLKLK
ncbi:MAG: TetR/AcrR family transcriptional regulator [Pseudomonadota bacterium]